MAQTEHPQLHSYWDLRRNTIWDNQNRRCYAFYKKTIITNRRVDSANLGGVWGQDVDDHASLKHVPYPLDPALILYQERFVYVMQRLQYPDTFYFIPKNEFYVENPCEYHLIYHLPCSAPDDPSVPDFISGCTFKTGPQLKIAYLAPFVFQTLIMMMTGYKAWSFTREQQSVPIMRRILYNEMMAYVGFVLLLMIVEVFSMIRATKTAIIGSLLFTAILSLMCSRILLHGFSLSRGTNVCTTYHEAIEINLVQLDPSSTLCEVPNRVQSNEQQDMEERMDYPK
ncbi:hypothetical protein RhiJN_21028 [Ceratobasidium sp. AG-Ba]|nr:hypothetical protein RhiJN_21028 [Ceratobasidium sp. AG-Ba]